MTILGAGSPWVPSLPASRPPSGPPEPLLLTCPFLPGGRGLCSWSSPMTSAIGVCPQCPSALREVCPFPCVDARAGPPHPQLLQTADSSIAGILPLPAPPLCGFGQASTLSEPPILVCEVSALDKFPQRSLGWNSELSCPPGQSEGNAPCPLAFKVGSTEPQGSAPVATGQVLTAPGPPPSSSPPWASHLLALRQSALALFTADLAGSFLGLLSPTLLPVHQTLAGRAPNGCHHPRGPSWYPHPSQSTLGLSLVQY